MIEWKFKEDAELVSPEGFWYEVTEGGYIKPGGNSRDLETDRDHFVVY